MYIKYCKLCICELGVSIYDRSDGEGNIDRDT